MSTIVWSMRTTGPGAIHTCAINDRGRGRVRTPKTDFEERKYIASTLSNDGIVPILQLLKSVNGVCEFTGAFKHFSTKSSKMAPAEEMFMAGITRTASRQHPYHCIQKAVDGLSQLLNRS